MARASGNTHEPPTKEQDESSTPQPQPQVPVVQNSNVPPEVAVTDLGTQLKFLGLVEEGMSKYLQALTINPNYAPAYYNIGVIYSESNHFEEALYYYNKAVEANRMYVEAYCNMGVIYKNTARLEEAITYYEKALVLNPNFTIARTNMAIALTDLGTKIKAEGKAKLGIQYYKKALTYNSQYPDAYYNLGVAFGEAHKYDRAIWYYELSVHFNPYCCEAYNNLGVIYRDQDNLDKSAMCYQSALAINPKFAQSLNNIGVVYTVQGKLDEAYAYVRSAIEEDPMYSEAYNNLGVLYRDEGMIAEAIKCYEKCLSINILSRNSGQNRLLAMNYLPSLEVKDVYRAHKDWGELFAKQFTRFSSFTNTLDTHRQLRIGYMSPDFFIHSVSYFIEAILTNHNKNDFHVICYSNVVKEDAKTHKLKQLPSEWRNITALSAQQAATLIREDKIDILVELAGHTSGNRLDVTAMKPAPIQITYIGYPNTCGVPTIDYRITDSVADPHNSDQYYVEELVRLPTGFLCYTPSPEAGSVLPLPALTNGHVTFGSFNNLAKINDEVLDLWSAILKAVNNSRLVIKCKPFASETVKKKFIAKFQDRGIDSSRLTLIGLLPMNHDHMQAYSLMDISLDTFPYAGTTTTCEALWMGVPVVTLTGKSHAHNVGASLLTQIGCPEWICSTKEQYIACAVSLSSCLSTLSKTRTSIRDRMQSSPLCDSKPFTLSLERVFRDKWAKYVMEQTIGKEEKSGKRLENGKRMMNGADEGPHKDHVSNGTNGMSNHRQKTVLRAPTPDGDDNEQHSQHR